MKLVQLEIDLSPSVTLYASTKFGPVPVAVDPETADRLNGRALSVGSHQYVQLWTEQQRHELLHRWILGANVRDGRFVDHRNGDRYDCRASNLRFVTAAENSANRRPTGLSGVLGVTPTPGGRWRARVQAGGKAVDLGTFRDLDAAARASDTYRREHVSGYLGRCATDPARHTAAA